MNRWFIRTLSLLLPAFSGVLATATATYILTEREDKWSHAPESYLHTELHTNASVGNLHTSGSHTITIQELPGPRPALRFPAGFELFVKTSWKYLARNGTFFVRMLQTEHTAVAISRDLLSDFN